MEIISLTAYMFFQAFFIGYCATRFRAELNLKARLRFCYFDKKTHIINKGKWEEKTYINILKPDKIYYWIEER